MMVYLHQIHALDGPVWLTRSDTTQTACCCLPLASCHPVRAATPHVRTRILCSLRSCDSCLHHRLLHRGRLRACLRVRLPCSHGRRPLCYPRDQARDTPDLGCTAAPCPRRGGHAYKGTRHAWVGFTVVGGLALSLSSTPIKVKNRTPAWLRTNRRGIIFGVRKGKTVCHRRTWCAREGNPEGERGDSQREQCERQRGRWETGRESARVRKNAPEEGASFQRMHLTPTPRHDCVAPVTPIGRRSLPRKHTGWVS